MELNEIEIITFENAFNEVLFAYKNQTRFRFISGDTLEYLKALKEQGHRIPAEWQRTLFEMFDEISEQVNEIVVKEPKTRHLQF